MNSTGVRDRSTPSTPSLVPSLQLGVVQENIGSANDEHLLLCQGMLGRTPSNQYSTRSTLQSVLAFFSQYRHYDEISDVYRDITCICIERMLARCRPDVSAIEEYTWRSSTDLQEFSGENQRL